MNPLVAPAHRVTRTLSSTARTEALCIHVVERLAPGGIETLVLDLVAGRDDLVFSLGGQAVELAHAWPAIRTIAPRLETFAKPDRLAPALVLRLARRFARLRPAAVIVHHIGPLLYAGIAARLVGVPTIVHVEHDVWHYSGRRHRGLLAFASAVTGARHVAVSGQAARTLGDLVPGAAVHVIPPGIDTDRFKPRNQGVARRSVGLPVDGVLIGSVGRLCTVKAHARLIEMMTMLAPDIRLVIVGDGPERVRLEQKAWSLGVAGRVIFLGHREDVDALYPAFDVFCLPSLMEGLPRCVLEAQACGVPVVATDVGGVGEAVCRFTGALTPVGDVPAMAQAVTEIVLNRGHGATSRMHVVDKFSLSKTRAAYQRLIEARPR